MICKYCGDGYEYLNWDIHLVQCSCVSHCQKDSQFYLLEYEGLHKQVCRECNTQVDEKCNNEQVEPYKLLLKYFELCE